MKVTFIRWGVARRVAQAAEVLALRVVVVAALPAVAGAEALPVVRQAQVEGGATSVCLRVRHIGPPSITVYRLAQAQTAVIS